MSPPVPDDAVANVSAACPHCQQSISAPGHDLTVMVRCPRCRAELRLSSIIAVTTPLPVEVIPNTSLRASRPDRDSVDSSLRASTDSLDARASELVRAALEDDAAFDAEKTMTVDPLPRPRPPPPPPSSHKHAPPPTDATVLDPSVLGPFPFELPPSRLPDRRSPDTTGVDPNFNPRPSPDATAFQAPLFHAPPSAPTVSAGYQAPTVATPYQSPAIIDVDSTAPMSRPPAIALTPPPAPASPVLSPGPTGPSASEAARAVAATQVALPEVAPRRGEVEGPSGKNPVRERFASLDPSRQRYQLQFVIAVFGSVTLSVLVDALLNTGPFFRTIASLFTVSMAALWVLVVAASAPPDADGGWSLPQQGLGNVLAAWRRIAADRARSKELTPPERTALLGRTMTGIAAPLAVGFELLRFLQLALYGFFGVGGGSALVFNVLSILAASAALAGFLVARRTADPAPAG